MDTKKAGAETRWSLLPLCLSGYSPNQVHRDLVAVVAIGVTILKCSSEVLLVRVTISHPRVVILHRVAICATARRVIAATATIVSARLVTLVVAGVQRCLPKLIRATKISVTIPLPSATPIV